MQTLLAGASFGEIVERIKNTVPTSWINSCKVWPVVTAFSFTYIPIQYRSIFGGVIAIGWQTYLSLLNQRAAAMELGEVEGGVKNAVVRERVVEERREGLREKEAAWLESGGERCWRRCHQGFDSRYLLCHIALVIWRAWMHCKAFFLERQILHLEVIVDWIIDSLNYSFRLRDLADSHIQGSTAIALDLRIQHQATSYETWIYYNIIKHNYGVDAPPPHPNVPRPAQGTVKSVNDRQNRNRKLLAERILYPPIANTGSDAQSTFSCDVIMARSTRRVKTRGAALMVP